MLCQGLCLASTSPARVFCSASCYTSDDDVAGCVVLVIIVVPTLLITVDHIVVSAVGRHVGVPFFLHTLLRGVPVQVVQASCTPHLKHRKRHLQFVKESQLKQGLLVCEYICSKNIKSGLQFASLSVVLSNNKIWSSKQSLLYSLKCVLTGEGEWGVEGGEGEEAS